MKHLIFILLLVLNYSNIAKAEITSSESASSENRAISRTSISSKKYEIVVNLATSTLSAPGVGKVKIGYGNVKKYGRAARTPKGTFCAGKLGDWLTNKKYNGKRVLLRKAIELVGGNGVLIHVGQGVGPVSHGCIRVPEHVASKLLANARKAGSKNVRIKIV